MNHLPIFLRLTEGHSFWWYNNGFEYWFVGWGWIFGAFWLGSCLGSFMNVCIWRMPLHQSVVNAPSHCTVCGHNIRWFDNIPVVSYLALRGRCRNCRTRIPPRYICVELLTGTLFALAVWKCAHYEQPPATITVWFAMILLAVTTIWTDFESRIIPDLLTYPAIGFGLAAAAVMPWIWGTPNRGAALICAASAAAIAAAVLSLFAWGGEKLCKKEVFGWGDVKFMTAAAVLLGLPGAVFALLCGCISGTAFAVARSMICRNSLRGSYIPLGPFLSLGCLIWIFCGEKLLRWYLSL